MFKFYSFIQAKKLREKIIDINNSRLIIKSVDVSRENLQVIGNKIIIVGCSFNEITFNINVVWNFVGRLLFS